MTTIHFTDLPKGASIPALPSGYWTGLVLFTALWLVPVITLIVLKYT